MRINKVAVIGAGTMGHGIAEVLAIAGYKVFLNDVSDDILKNALDRIKLSLGKLYEKGQIKEKPEAILNRIETSTNIEDALKDSDFMIEAVIENLEVKREVFKKADLIAPKHAILATNTSSLPIAEIAEFVERKNKVIGLHFFNPPVLMKLVEVIRSEYTSEDTLKTSLELCNKLEKETVIVNKDIAGFIVNRILAREINVACMLAHKGLAGIEEIDAVFRYRLNFPMGPFELADYSGIDVFYYIFEIMTKRGFKLNMCPLIKEKFERKELGVKSGIGFYSYPAPGKYQKPQLDKEKATSLDPVILLALPINEACYLLRESIASRSDIDKAVMLGLSYPKGIFRFADEFGIDRVVIAIEKIRELGIEDVEVDPILIKMLEEKTLGIKAGKGFFKY